MRFNEMSIDAKVKDLIERVALFHMLSLPGQPQGMHMGTSYLVNDLLRTVEELRSEIEELHSK